MKLIALAFLLFAPATFAATKPVPVYVDGVLKSYRTETVGKACSSNADTTGTVRANQDGTGDATINANTTGTTSCHNVRRVFYTVVIGEQTFVITPKINPLEAGGIVLTMGIAAIFHKDSVLYGQLPGTPIKVRTDAGTFYVKVGKRETQYKLVSAQ